MNSNTEKLLVGALKQCDLPQLHIKALNMPIVTGAKTSSLHVDIIETEKTDTERWVTFDIHPDIHYVSHVTRARSYA